MNPGLGPWTARIKLIALVALLMLAAGCDRLPPRQATATPLPVPTPVQTPDSSLPPEILAARDAGLRTVAFSIVTNYSNLFHAQAHSQDEIRHNAAQASGKLRCLISGLVKILTEP